MRVVSAGTAGVSRRQRPFSLRLPSRRRGQTGTACK